MPQENGPHAKSGATRTLVGEAQRGRDRPKTRLHVLPSLPPRSREGGSTRRRQQAGISRVVHTQIHLQDDDDGGGYASGTCRSRFEQ